MSNLRVDANLQFTEAGHTTAINSVKKICIRDNASATLSDTITLEKLKLFPFHTELFNLTWDSYQSVPNQIDYKINDFIRLTEGLSQPGGYRGTVFLKSKSFECGRPFHQVVIVHRGTVPSKKGTLEADLKGVCENRVAPTVNACVTFTLKVLCWLEEGFGEEKFLISTTGHSLGGWLSQISAFCIKYIRLMKKESEPELEFVITNRDDMDKYHPQVVTFDSPGAKEIINVISRFESFRKYMVGVDIRLDVITYCITPNFVNVMNQHIGAKRVLKPVSPQEYKAKKAYTKILQDLKKHTFEYHILERFKRYFGSDEENSRKEPFGKEIKDWPLVIITAGDTSSSVVENTSWLGIILAAAPKWVQLKNNADEYYEYVTGSLEQVNQENNEILFGTMTKTMMLAALKLIFAQTKKELQISFRESGLSELFLENGTNYHITKNGRVSFPSYQHISFLRYCLEDKRLRKALGVSSEDGLFNWQTFIELKSNWYAWEMEHEKYFLPQFPELSPKLMEKLKESDAAYGSKEELTWLILKCVHHRRHLKAAFLRYDDVRSCLWGQSCIDVGDIQFLLIDCIGFLEDDIRNFRSEEKHKFYISSSSSKVIWLVERRENGSLSSWINFEVEKELVQNVIGSSKLFVQGFLHDWLGANFVHLADYLTRSKTSADFLKMLRRDLPVELFKNMLNQHLTKDSPLYISVEQPISNWESFYNRISKDPERVILVRTSPNSRIENTKALMLRTSSENVNIIKSPDSHTEIFDAVCHKFQHCKVDLINVVWENELRYQLYHELHFSPSLYRLCIEVAFPNADLQEKLQTGATVHVMHEDGKHNVEMGIRNNMTQITSAVAVEPVASSPNEMLQRLKPENVGKLSEIEPLKNGLFLLIGESGSGKSTWASRVFRDHLNGKITWLEGKLVFLIECNVLSNLKYLGKRRTSETEIVEILHVIVRYLEKDMKLDKFELAFLKDILESSKNEKIGSRVVLIFVGFEKIEISRGCDSLGREEVRDMLKELRTKTWINMIVTSKPECVLGLTQALGVLPHWIIPYENKDYAGYLESIWLPIVEDILEEEEFKADRVKKFAKTVVKKGEIDGLNSREFCGQHFQLSMLAEVFLSKAVSYVKSNHSYVFPYNLAQLYETYIERKGTTTLPKGAAKVPWKSIRDIATTRCMYLATLELKGSCSKPMKLLARDWLVSDLFWGRGNEDESLILMGLIRPNSEGKQNGFIHSTFVEFFVAKALYQIAIFLIYRDMEGKDGISNIPDEDWEDLEAAFSSVILNLLEPDQDEEKKRIRMFLDGFLEGSRRDLLVQSKFKENHRLFNDRFTQCGRECRPFLLDFCLEHLSAGTKDIWSTKRWPITVFDLLPLDLAHMGSAFVALHRLSGPESPMGKQSFLVDGNELPTSIEDLDERYSALLHQSENSTNNLDFESYIKKAVEDWRMEMDRRGKDSYKRLQLLIKGNSMVVPQSQTLLLKSDHPLQIRGKFTEAAIRQRWVEKGLESKLDKDNQAALAKGAVLRYSTFHGEEMETIN